MKVLQINWSDLIGRAFNGYDLHIELNKRGISSKQLVLKKQSDLDSVIQLPYDEVLLNEIVYMEKKNAITDLLYPYALQIADMDCFKEADIVHYHILHQMVSLFDYPFLMKLKPSVMTIHDLWPFTGKCTYPLGCMKWMVGCEQCQRKNEIFYGQEIDNSRLMWNIKQNIYKEISPQFVLGSNFTKKYFEQSPAFRGKRSRIIPFGVDCDRFQISSKERYRDKYQIDKGKIVISFRADNYSIKGCDILYKALDALAEMNNQIVLLCMGGGEIPEHVKKMFEVHEFGWVNSAVQMSELLVVSDIFVMPSLAETFGLMAIEAMAAENAIICFEDTVLQEVTDAPNCGIAVKNGSEKELGNALLSLCKNEALRVQRSVEGRRLAEMNYQLDKYVDEHILLYKQVLNGLS